MQKTILDENFFDDLYSLEINEESYKNFDLINDLLINKKETIDNYELFINGYVSKLIKTKFRNIRSVDEIKFEINKLELFANNLPFEVSKELFSSEDVVDALLILKPKILNYIFKDSDTKLLSIITNAYLKKYSKEKNKTEKIKEEYEILLEKNLIEKKLNQEDLIHIKEEVSSYTEKIKKQNQKEEKCLAFVMTLNSLLMETLSNNSKNITK